MIQGKTVGAMASTMKNACGPCLGHGLPVTAIITNLTSRFAKCVQNSAAPFQKATRVH